MSKESRNAEVDTAIEAVVAAQKLVDRLPRGGELVSFVNLHVSAFAQLEVAKHLLEAAKSQ